VTTLALLGIAAGILSVVDPIPYIRDILRGTTRPHRGTWLIWSVLGATAFASQLSDGATWSLAMVGVQTVSITLILLLSIRRGVGGASRLDLTLICIAGLGIVGWAVTDEPVVATAFVVFADAIGVGLMTPKAWRDPWSETLSTYVLASASGVLSTAAVGTLDASLLLYPAYFAIANGAIAVVIASRRRQATSRPEGRLGRAGSAGARNRPSGTVG
jgi:hypothetical protein